MIIVYRDELGIVSIEIDINYNIAFLGDKIIFGTLDDKAMELPIKSIVCIDIKRT